MKRIILVIVLVVVALVITSLILWRTQENKRNYDAIVEKCKEEFTFDYEEEIVIITTERFNNDYIVTIYGEEHYGVCQSSRDEPPSRRHDRYRLDCYAPPH